MVLFEIVPRSPEIYRRETRRSTLIVAATFAVLAMGLAALAVALFGEPDGDNLRLNIGGVVAGLVLTVALVRLLYWQQPWMAAAVYGWQLKRSLMRVTNMMHQVKAGVAAGDPAAIKLLRFYHLALTQMHQLDGNSHGLSESVAEIDRHRETMEALNMDIDQPRLESAWLERVGQIEAKR
ncbi:DUF3087 domain-containing protein [Pseudomonas songnenensis]|uniref:DUF3087 domain-containing protein n=1 Tax=Pseudomonas songnenensis TaxID=1176259 RepID=A0ABX9UXD0_9PSED|nr:DUF3087 domain-containing protein [Pseudomonas songnenensis]MCQ4302053.1 DUF3087 domain-containing protein [Pseudomonas songnenensis]RMH98065.1 DUF3087 domain-containing protein [Pseudomonas songnenensis]